MAAYDEMAGFFAESAGVYTFLSQVFFKELTAEAVEALAGFECPEDVENEKLAQGYAMVRRYLSFASDDARTQLACEYARVFLAAGVYTPKRDTAIPYESVFTSEERIVMQDARDDAVARYAADGFQVNPGLHEPEDHLSFELEYLAHMSRRAAAAAEAGDAAALAHNVARQAEFIDGHLLNWVGRLREAAQGYAKLTFYIGMLLIAEGTLEESRAALAGIAGEVGAGDGAAAAAAAVCA